MATVDASKVRNVGLLGHSGTGKTMLIEHVLHMAGKTSRVGSIADGNTVGDYLEEEQERQQTITMKVMSIDWEDARIHFVDHPGYADFLGEEAASTAVLDSVIIVISANNARRETIVRARKLIETAKADIAGVVLNGLETTRRHYYYYYYYYEDSRSSPRRRWYHL